MKHEQYHHRKALAKRVSFRSWLIVFVCVVVCVFSFIGETRGGISANNNNKSSKRSSDSYSLPPQFVYLEQIDPTIIQEIRYYTDHNFVGHGITGYDYPSCILTAPAAKALSRAQQYLMSQNPPYTLKVYDCYRPKMAVNEFLLWSRNNDTLMKEEFYPFLNKTVLFPDGYIAINSSHCRGSTVDLTIVPYPPANQSIYIQHQALVPCMAPEGVRFQDNSIDMGTGFDCFSVLAHTASPLVNKQQMENRMFLNTTMSTFGFKNYDKEWWHFTLINEPFPTTEFDFPIGTPSTPSV
jgi:D-alanyl-D-alanine dipeptidase